MKRNPKLLRQLMRNENWSKESLARLTAKELEALSILMGVPKSGTKAKKASRLLVIWKLRWVLSRYNDEPKILAADFKVKELRYLAGIAGSYRWSTKYGIATGLLNWRNQCRHRGQRAYREAMEEIKVKPGQLSLF